MPPPGWIVSAPATAAYETTTPQSGLRSLNVTFAAGVNTGQVATIRKYAVRPGDAFRVTGYIRSDGVNAAWIGISFLDLNGAVVGVLKTTAISAAAWTLAKGTAVAPANSISARVVLLTDSVAGFTAGFDNINVTRTVTSFEVSPINTQGAFIGTNPLSNDGVATSIAVAARSVQFGDGPIAYSAGSVDPLAFGVWYVYADDLALNGGAVTYQATSDPSILTAANGRMSFGKITTAAAVPAAGVGGGGGCVEDGTFVVEPRGSTQVIEENSDWIALTVPKHEPINMHPDTLVTVYRKASELEPGDRIAVGFHGKWRTDWTKEAFTRPSRKVKRACPGGRYRAGSALVELHNSKPAPL
jgi:hypothetical protein